MTLKSLSQVDRRLFLRGAGIALALPAFETFGKVSFATAKSGASDEKRAPPKRLACFYMPDGVPMPLQEDPAFQDWSWFPHGEGKDYQLTKCLEPLGAVSENLTVLSGLSHPAARSIHGHSNADQFLTGAATGGHGDYQNSISLDQRYAQFIGDETRIASMVLSTDGGTGTPRGTHTMSFDRSGRAIPAEHKPKRIFDMLFVKQGEDAARRLAVSKSALDDLMEDANNLRRSLSKPDQAKLEEYLQALRDTELKVAKAKRWMDLPIPEANVDHLNLDVTPEDPRNYLQTMFELIYMAFKTDTTRVATYQIGRENGVGVSDYMARAIGFNLTHQLSHQTKEPEGWKNFGSYNRFLAEELCRFAKKLKATPEENQEGNMLDHTLLLFGSASSAFHLSRNYPLVLIGGNRLGFEHNQYLKCGIYPEGGQPAGGAWKGGREPWQKEMNHQERPLGDLFLTMLNRLGVETQSFAGSQAPLDSV
ncbi:MAG: DUF1552 domain-containing protein [Planctomycetota bacterium]|nr:DUF1552 domain-containing protein [Planctomycetota bacterium]